MASRPAERTYIVAAVHRWNRDLFDSKLSTLPGNWLFVDSRDGLTADHVTRLNPHTIFFLHWSWKVPPEITKRRRCIVFHMTDVPYGRGGSPLQNLILRGHTETVLSAIQMTQEMDAGPVFMKRPLSLDGAAHEIFQRAAELAATMIEEIIASDPEPIPQSGEPVLFKRRTPEESQVPVSLSATELFDFIRMLDADGYPRAFIDANGYRVELSDAALSGDAVSARARIRRVADKSEAVE